MANGSELDALYAHVLDGTLYLFLTGNQLSRDGPSDPGFWANELNLLFDARAGGQGLLRSDNYDVGNFPGGQALANLAGVQSCSLRVPVHVPNWGRLTRVRLRG